MASFTSINRPLSKMDAHTGSENSHSYDNDNDNNNNTTDNSQVDNRRLKSWQRSALRHRRNPLPESPGDRPWIGQPSSNSQPSGHSSATVPFASSVSGASSFYSSSSSTNQPRPMSTDTGSASSSTAGVPQSYRFWPEAEMRRLIALKKSGADWPAVCAAFPNRTPEALKQAYHKRRYTVERQMAQEAEGKTAAGCSDKATA
ncbi:hypothetical protein F66182_4832 [Fusarium sp. NRRL 66182]|nr:hypothetical protein F66182_4832 [Fusarium sp. NRRL 66182]